MDEWSGRLNDIKKFQQYKHLARRVTDRAYERYLGDILGINTTSEQVENSPPKVNTKKMYSLSPQTLKKKTQVV